MRAWFMDEVKGDQRKPHMTDPPQFVSLEELKKIGVLYFQIDADTCENTDSELQKIKKERNYTYSDFITCNKELLPNYDEKIKILFKEHLHDDEEIRFIVDGTGYFDVRNADDRWIRIEMVKNDLIILPAGIYHRFTLDEKDYLKAMRLFVGDPVWTPHNRPQDDHPARIEYMKNFIMQKAA